ncbi:MAG: hypothetical protein IJV11_01285 [Muribaculaceae bacterium]|nr:hypothetical protein [Muribaculaceae bacterium]
MRRILFIALAMIAAIGGRAQINQASISVVEPEFEQEAILVTSETEGIPLEVEHSKLRATANVGMAMLGIAKGSEYYQLEGAESPVTLDASAYDNDMYIIISWEDNKRSPKRLFQIIPLEIQKKRRIYNVAKLTAFKGTVAADQGYVNFTAEKYGEHSYLIRIPAEELRKLRDDNGGEMKKYGKQFVIRLLNASTDKLSDTEDFLTFGIAKPNK